LFHGANLHLGTSGGMALTKFRRAGAQAFKTAAAT
jgi:hypothetical protein